MYKHCLYQLTYLYIDPANLHLILTGIYHYNADAGIMSTIRDTSFTFIYLVSYLQLFFSLAIFRKKFKEICSSFKIWRLKENNDDKKVFRFHKD